MVWNKTCFCKSSNNHPDGPACCKRGQFSAKNSLQTIRTGCNTSFYPDGSAYYKEDGPIGQYFLQMILIIQIRSPEAKSRDISTRKQCFRCFRFISKQRCTVQGALWAKSTTSETELFPILPSSAVINKQKGRAPAVEGIGNCADASS